MKTSSLVFILSGLLYLALATMCTGIKAEDKILLTIKILFIFILIVAAIVTFILGGTLA